MLIENAMNYVTSMGTRLSIEVTDVIKFTEDGVEKALSPETIDDILLQGTRIGDYIEYDGERYKFLNIYAIQAFKCSMYNKAIVKELVKTVTRQPLDPKAPFRKVEGVTVFKAGTLLYYKFSETESLKLNETALKVLHNLPSFEPMTEGELTEGEKEFLYKYAGVKTSAGTIYRVSNVYYLDGEELRLFSTLKGLFAYV